MSAIPRRKTGTRQPGRRTQCVPAAPEWRVDPGALGLAAVAAGVSVVSSEGNWGLVDTMLGLVLLLVVVAYHRLPPSEGGCRRSFMKWAFSGVAALTLTLVFGWPAQQLVVEPWDLSNRWLFEWAAAVDSPGAGELAPDDATTAFLSLCWFPVTVLIYRMQPWLLLRLDGWTSRGTSPSHSLPPT